MKLVLFVCINRMHTLITDYNNIGKFLNRILGMEVQQQNALFQYFADTLAAVIQEAKKNGRFDMGILGKIVFLSCSPLKQKAVANTVKLSHVCFSCPMLDLGSGDEKVKKMDCRKFLTPGYTTSGHVELFTVSIDCNIFISIFTLNL